MKNKVKQQIFVSVIFVLSVAIIYKLYNPTIIKVPVQVQPNVINYPEPIRERVREREFRGPPIKQYKPGFTQQMGIITGPNEETLPIYGKEVRGRRDRYHYYTTTGGENLYPIPISHNSRDCTEDIGCEELYGNETVSVTGKTGSFNVNMYRTDDFF
jgi:hypothetical protein